MDEFDEAGFAGAVSRLPVACTRAFVREQDVQPRVETESSEARQVAGDFADHGSSLRSRPRSIRTAPIA
jgi:hypothetical protein